VQGRGGATATGGANACASCQLMVAAQCQTSSDTQTIRVVVDVEDAAISPLALADVTFRYWFVMGTPTDTPMLTIDYAQISMTAGATITSKFAAVSPARTGANEYLEVGFGPNTPPLTLFGDTGQIQLRFFGSNNNNMFDLDQKSDYSYQACGASASTAYNSAPTITGYINGTLAWGTEPQ
jgi:Cellulose binding domain